MSAKYYEYKAKFPNDLLNKVQTIYRPLFDYIRLENELYVLYHSNDFVRKHAHELITFIKSMNLQPGFSEVCNFDMYYSEQHSFCWKNIFRFEVNKLMLSV